MGTMSTALLLAALLGAPALQGQDAEAATHDTSASTPQISFEERSGGFVLRQYQLGCLSQLTYLLGSDGVGVVVDPQRDVEHYLRDAQELGLEIRAVYLTHTNADFVAGHTELAARTGAEILISAASNSAFQHRPLQDGDRYPFGSAELEFWATPGHTLDAMTALVRISGSSATPSYALTGDTLFLGGIGRPDLVGGEITPAILAGKAYDSIARFAALPDATRILPAHGAGSLCGAHLSPDTSALLGAERLSNPYLLPQSRAAFVSRMIEGLPIAPQYFRHNVALNRAGPPVLEWSNEAPPALAPRAVADHAAQGAWLVDLRSAQDYAAGHVAGAINIALRGRVDTWLGTVVPFDAPVILIGSEEDAREAAFRFRRIGYDAPRGWLAGGMEAWQQAGLPLRKTELLTPAELARRIAAGTEPLLVDVRTEAEHADLRIPGAGLMPLSDWQDFARVLDPKQPTLFACNSAYRSSMAVGLAERQGFTQVSSLDGGLDAWISAGMLIEGDSAHEVADGSLCADPEVCADAASAPEGTALLLPEAMDVAALARVLDAQPERWALFDIRSAAHFAEYHMPGAINLGLADLDAAVAALPAGTHVLLLDRDGTQSFAAAGALLTRHPGRDVRVLLGGTAAWWSERYGSSDAVAAALPPSAPAAAAPAAAKPTSKPAAKKTRSAGC
jgi:rhodanese-related sulfurtransferase/glyoxylase-like metal-dependent hydrolase (beta-lactamase superfamily II)